MPLYRVELHRDIVLYQREHFSHYVRADNREEAEEVALLKVLDNPMQYLDKTELEDISLNDPIHVNNSKVVDD